MNQGFYIIFKRSVAECWDENTLVFQAYRAGSLYKVNEKGVALATQHELQVPIPVPHESKAELWHRRLAHTNYRDITTLVRKSKGVEIEKKVYLPGRQAYEGCLAGKMKESLNKKTDTKTSVRGRRLHADTSGRLSLSIRGFRYFLLIVDDATRCTWICLLKTLQTIEVLPELRKIIANIETSTSNKVVEFRADNGKGEFGPEFQNHLRNIRVHFEPCPPYKHSMNGVIERAIYTVNCKARSLLYQASLPEKFWCFAIEHAVYVKNRVPTSALPYGDLKDYTTPFEAYKEAIPDLSRLRTFGCSA